MEDIKMDQYMSSTTKIPFHSGKEYHVFLSFRGKDVRNTLVHQLYEALTAAGLDVFLDSEKLKKGEIIGSSLERAVDSSAIRIPIFSEGYADSAWCLKEAARMLRTPGLIIPLFYKVDPTDVRYPLNNSSRYKKSFDKHYDHPDRYQREDVDGWKDIHQICSRSGWSMDLRGGSEAQLIKTVVNDVIKTFDRVQLQVAKHPVGMDTLTHHLIHKFKLNSEGGVIKAGLWGIGGIGKTTLAKALYNQVSGKFESASFVFNVRTTAAEFMGLTKLQKKILKDLSNHDGEVDSVEEGISLFRHRLRQKSVLLILDDVDRVEQLNALDGDWLAPGSRVIITSRDRHILHLAGVSSECIHKMSGLQINEGLQLFSWHAFLRPAPTPTHEDLSQRMVEACKGHPLSLEVIGSFLYDKQNDPDCWTEALHNITLHPGIHERLKMKTDISRHRLLLHWRAQNVSYCFLQIFLIVSDSNATAGSTSNISSSELFNLTLHSFAMNVLGIENRNVVEEKRTKIQERENGLPCKDNIWDLRILQIYCNLSQLPHLDLRECTNLNYFPDAIGNLSQLQHLDLRVCTNKLLP